MIMKTISRILIFLILAATASYADSIQSFTANQTNVQPGTDVNLTLDYVATKKYQLTFNAYNDSTNVELTPIFNASDLRHVSYSIPSTADYNIKLVLGLVEDGNIVDSKELILNIFSGNRNCLDYYNAGYRTDGIYNIDPDESGPLNEVSVYCDMTNGGWTKFENMNSGWDGHPGDMSTKTTYRIPLASHALYLALAERSTYQKFDIAKGQSEDTYDWYQFRRKNNEVIFSPENHGTHCNNDRTWGESGRSTIHHSGDIIQIDKNPEKAFWYTRYDTDCSVNAGAGAYTNNIIWFK